MPKVFISYRRADSGGQTGRLLDDLERRFGRDKFFRDIEDLEPGTDFPEALDRALSQCDAVLVMIGPAWASAAGQQGRRLEQAGDFVHVEVATALARKDVRVIPVLVGGATIPAAEELPEDLQALQRRNAIELSDTRWEYDVKRLGDALAKQLAPVPPPWPWRMILAVSLPLVALSIIIGSVYYYRYGYTRRWLQVPGDREWSPTPIEVNPGESIDITASGRVIYWQTPEKNYDAGPEGDANNPCPHPNCPMRGKPSAELLGKIGEDGSPFEVGTDKTVAVSAPGQLYLGVNDPLTSDNSGSFSVAVKLQ
jgi:hypothetical protein